MTDRRIVPIDDGPLRKRASKECSRAMAKLEAARAELRRFEQEDQPSFGRWMATTFGAILTELRENERLAREKEALIREVEMEMMYGNHRNPRSAYAAVMKRRENPEPGEAFAEADEYDDARDAFDDEEDEDDFDSFEEMGAQVPEEERRALFEDFLRSVAGISPGQLGEAEYARMFAEFEAELFGGPAQPGPFQPRDVERTPSAGPEEARIKELYRILVRRLHPDLRADGDATVSAIWHEVQEAYASGNLDRLETLLALTEVQGGTNGGEASLSQMRVALKELERALRAIQRSAREMKRHPAWGFSRNPYNGPMETRIRRELEESLSEQKSIIAEQKRILDDWSRPWHPPARKTRKRAGGARPAVPRPIQTELFAFP